MMSRWFWSLTRSMPLRSELQLLGPHDPHSPDDNLVLRDIRLLDAGVVIGEAPDLILEGGVSTGKDLEDIDI